MFRPILIFIGHSGISIFIKRHCWSRPLVQMWCAQKYTCIFFQREGRQHNSACARRRHEVSSAAFFILQLAALMVVLCKLRALEDIVFRICCVQSVCTKKSVTRQILNLRPVTKTLDDCVCHCTFGPSSESVADSYMKQKLGFRDNGNKTCSYERNTRT